MRRDDRLDVPTAMSSRSTSAARRPRDVASSSAPQPTMPPPTRGRRTAQRPSAVADRGRRSVGRRASASSARRPRPARSARARPRSRRARTTISSGVRNTIAWPSAGSRLVATAAPRTTTTLDAADDEHVPKPDRPLSHGRPRRDADRGDEDPPGERRARSACAGPVFGRWKVIVRSARTAGSDGWPLDRSTAVGVSIARTGTIAARARLMSSTALRIGSRSTPRTPVPSSASTTIDAFSIPWPRIATSRPTGAWMSVTPGSRTRRSQFRAASAALGRPSGATKTTIDLRALPARGGGPRRSRRRRCCPGRRRSRSGPSASARSRRPAPAPRRRPRFRPAPSAARRARRAPAPCGRRRPSPRRSSAAAPAVAAQRSAQAAQVELEQSRHRPRAAAGRSATRSRAGRPRAQA